MHNIVGDVDVLENLAQFLRNFFFTKIWGAALTSVATATVVDVLSLLHFWKSQLFFL